MGCLPLTNHFANGIQVHPISQMGCTVSVMGCIPFGDSDDYFDIFYTFLGIHFSPNTPNTYMIKKLMGPKVCMLIQKWVKRM